MCGLLSINVFWNQEFFDVLKFWPLAFGPSLTIASSLLHPYSTDAKPLRLMVKQFSTSQKTQRDSQSYMEKREEEDRGDQEDKRGNQKGREKSSH